MIEISKELLNKVLKKNKKRFSSDDNYLYYIKEKVKEYDKKVYLDCQFKINIYELAHICKEFIISNGFGVLSGIDQGKYSCYLDDKNDSTDDILVFYANTEVEAIIKACEWVLEKIKEGN